MIGITFRQLEVFCHLVEAGSVRACAEALSISAVAVGEHVRALERQLGCVLFHRRRGTTAMLTEAGEQTYRRAKDLIESATALVTAFDSAPRDPARRKLRIAAHGYIAEQFTRELAEFMTGNPRVEIECQRRMFEGVLQGLLDDAIDVGFFLSYGAVPEIESVCAWQEEIAIYVGDRHPLAASAIVEMSELVRFPFVYLPGKTHLRGQFDSLLGAAGISGSPVALTCDEHMLAVESLAGNRNVACLFVHGTDEIVESHHLKRLQLSQPLPPLDIRYAIRERCRHDPYVNLLASHLSARGTAPP